MGTDDMSEVAAALDGDTLARIAVDAGAVIQRIYDEGCDVEWKGDSSPVTLADRAAEALILERLSAIAPGLTVVAEEACEANGLPLTGTDFVLVDPLDGTREFVSRNADFTVNIAVIAKGVPVRGVVYAPARQLLFVAAGPGEAWQARVVPGGDLPPVSGRQRLAIRAIPDEGMTAVTSRSHGSSATYDFLRAFNVAHLRQAGSSLKFCLIAAGEADIYPRFGRTMEWDTAAGQAVVEAAGGKVLTLDGQPLRYGKGVDGGANPDFVVYGADASPS